MQLHNASGFVRYVLEHCSDVNHSNQFGVTALHYASSYGCLNIARYLIEQCCADVGVKSREGNSALHIASSRVNPKIVRYLVEQGYADVNAKTTKVRRL